MVSRYGVKIRKRESKIIDKMRGKHTCPKCGKESVKRKGTAQWNCKACGAEFVGGSYTPQTMAGKESERALARINSKTQ